MQVGPLNVETYESLGAVAVPVAQLNGQGIVADMHRIIQNPQRRRARRQYREWIDAADIDRLRETLWPAIDRAACQASIAPDDPVVLDWKVAAWARYIGYRQRTEATATEAIQDIWDLVFLVDRPVEAERLYLDQRQLVRESRAADPSLLSTQAKWVSSRASDYYALSRQLSREPSRTRPSRCDRAAPDARWTDADIPVRLRPVIGSDDERSVLAYEAARGVYNRLVPGIPGPPVSRCQGCPPSQNRGAVAAPVAPGAAAVPGPPSPRGPGSVGALGLGAPVAGGPGAGVGLAAAGAPGRALSPVPVHPAAALLPPPIRPPSPAPQPLSPQGGISLSPIRFSPSPVVSPRGRTPQGLPAAEATSPPDLLLPEGVDEEQSILPTMPPGFGPEEFDFWARDHSLD